MKKKFAIDSVTARSLNFQILDNILTIILSSFFVASTYYRILSYRQCSRFIKFLHQHRHHDWIKFGAPDAPFWKGVVRQNHRVTHKTHFNSFNRRFSNSIPAFKKKFNEEESQKILARYRQDTRLSAIFLIAFGVSIFAAIAISPK